VREPPQKSARSPIAREVARVLQAFARTTRARKLYRSNNVTLIRMMGELSTSFAQLLEQLGEVSLKIRPEAILFEDEMVLEEPNPDESIPFAFYRDGIRRLDLSQGLDDKELEVLVSATAEGFAFSGLGDDIVSYLWRHDLEHVRYVVVDTTIIDAAGAPDPTHTAQEYDLDSQIEGLLFSIYGKGTNDDVGPRSVRVDASDISAKNIAETLDKVDEMAPGFHPARVFGEPPAYADELRTELEIEDEDQLTVRAAKEAMNAMLAGLEALELDALGELLMRMYDAALVSQKYGVSGKIVRGMRSLADAEVTALRADAWIAEAVSEARLRQISLQSSGDAKDMAPRIDAFFEACGPRAVPAILTVLPTLQDPARRRAIAELVVRIGVDHLDPVRALLTSEQAFVAVEAVHILSRLDSIEAHELLLSAQSHSQGPVRASLLAQAGKLPQAQQLVLAVQLLDDHELEVKIAAARLLGQVKDIRAVRTIEAKIKDPTLLSMPTSLKHALLDCYVQLVGAKALPTLAKMFQDGGGLLAKKDAEDLAILAAHCLGSLATPGAVTALKKAGTFLNLKVREAAQEALRRTKVKV
jgi:HEAT repeat protein